MVGAHFTSRTASVDQRSLEFLRTLVALGGYCTAAQAKHLGIAGSGTRTRAHLRALDRAGFLRKVSAYPVVYQATKSTTRLLERDSRARRPHILATVQARLLAVNFYLEARRWPAEFIFAHDRKIATLTAGGCPLSLLPQLGGKPYLWEDFVLWLVDGRVGVAIVDQPHPSAFSQVRQFIRRFHPLLQRMQSDLQLLIVTGNQHRAWLYRRLLHDSAVRKISQPNIDKLVRPYCLRAPLLSVARLLYPTSSREEVRHHIPLVESDEASEPIFCGGTNP